MKMNHKKKHFVEKLKMTLVTSIDIDIIMRETFTRKGMAEKEMIPFLKTKR
jgi:hypothetical protein